MGSTAANSSGETRIPVNLQKRLVIRLAQGDGVEQSGAGAAPGLLLSVRQTAGGMEFIIGGWRADAMVLQVFDLRGRLIRAWDNAASGRIFWSGAGKDGGRAPAGVYIARLTAGSAARATPFVMVK
jgi:hypothetical protein